jgi:glutathionyl-hydroquinone reductase
MIPISVVHWYMAERGWTFMDGDGVVADPINDADYMYEVYQAADGAYTGRVTVPVLWDKQKNTIVSNESADIIRMFNSAFDGVGATEGDYYPEPLREEIDEINARVYSTVNNGVYKSACSRRYCVSTRCMSGTSSATGGESWISNTYGPTCVTCTRSLASQRPCTWITSKHTIT